MFTPGTCEYPTHLLLASSIVLPHMPWGYVNQLTSALTSQETCVPLHISAYIEPKTMPKVQVPQKLLAKWILRTDLHFNIISPSLKKIRARFQTGLKSGTRGWSWYIHDEGVLLTDFLPPQSLLILPSYRNQDYRHRASTNNNCVLPHQSLIDKMTYRLVYRKILWRHFLNLGSFFSDNSSLWKVDIKIVMAFNDITTYATFGPMGLLSHYYTPWVLQLGEDIGDSFPTIYIISSGTVKASQWKGRLVQSTNLISMSWAKLCGIFSSKVLPSSSGGQPCLMEIFDIVWSVF